MDNYLQQGIAAAKSGDRSRAFDLLTRASENPATSEQAWLWLSGVVSDDSERLFCLDSVLKINSNNTSAHRGAAMLRQKGVFPAFPVYPDPQPAVVVQSLPSKPVPRPNSYQVDFAMPAPSQKVSVSPATSTIQQQVNFGTDWNKQQLSGLFQYALMELSSNKSHQAVEKLLVSRGASLESAKTIVKDAQYAIKKSRREKHKKRITRGLIWTVLGVVITCGTYAFADQLGGKFFLFYGAIIAGFIDFIIGLIGWLVNS